MKNRPACRDFRPWLGFLLTATLLAVFTWLALMPQRALAQPDQATPLDIHISLARLPKPDTGILPGPAVAIVTIVPRPGWYTYANDPGSLGKPTILSARVEGSPDPLPTAYPPGTSKPDPLSPGDRVLMYDGATPLFASIPAKALGSLRLEVAVDALMCQDKRCLPVVATARFEQHGVSLDALPAAQQQPWWPQYQKARPSVPQEQASMEGDVDAGNPAAVGDTWQWNISPRYHAEALEVRGVTKALFLAFLAGFILNFMPCVLPVVSLKLAGILASSTLDDLLARQRSFMRHNLAFAAGVLSYFGALSLVLSAAGMAWGQIFQQPTFIMILTALVFALGLSLFGVYHLPVIDLRQNPHSSSSPAVSAYFTGLLATLLATPCSGPFLGGVLAWAFMQPPTVVAMVFMAVGAGMASPYLLMAVWPGLVRFFPRPGAWTGKLEAIVGFFLLATCIYLLQILPAQRLVNALVLLWLTAVCAWAWGAWGGLEQTRARRMAVGAGAVAVLLAGGLYLTAQPQAEAHWEGFAPAPFAKRMGTEPLLVDFTADWCVSCKFLERSTLRSDNLLRWQRRYGLKYIRVDLTANNPAGMSLLQALGSKSVPVVAIFPPGEGAVNPLVLRDLFTSSTLEDALAQSLAPR